MSNRLRSSFLFNVLMVLLACVALYFLFFSSLGIITRHGDELIIPDVKGKSAKDAIRVMEQMGFDVDIDSAYEFQKEPFIVLNQMPEQGAVVKNGRTVFLTINKVLAPQTPMPKLTDLSYRSAVMVLKSSKLNLGDTIHKPDYAIGAVLEQQYDGRTVHPGAMIPQGSRIDLVIGDGFGNVEMDIPDVTGMPVLEGIALITGYGLTPIVVYDANVRDTANAFIYHQSPQATDPSGIPNKIREGDVVDLRVGTGAGMD